MAEVKAFPGTYRRELDDTACAPNTSLQAAMERPLLDVVIVGRETGGQLRVWCSKSDIDAALGMLMQGVTIIGHSSQVHLRDPDDEGA